MRVNQRTIWLRVFSLVCLLASATILQAADQPLTDFTTDEKDKTHWFDVQNLDVEGKGWTDTESFYDRLPQKAKGVVRPPVWSLSKHSAGMAVRFVTDATTIKARWTLTSASLAMMPLGRSGSTSANRYRLLATSLSCVANVPLPSLTSLSRRRDANLGSTGLTVTCALPTTPLSAAIAASGSEK